MRMQLKVTDSTRTGLSDKDIKKLTVVRHTLLKDFDELTTMLDNMAGITGLVFGLASPINSMLRGWSRFLTKSGGTVVTSLRHLTAADKTAPSRLGWLIDRRLQQFLTACASCDHADLVDLDLFDFRQALRDGAFMYPLCPYLADKFNGRDSGQPRLRSTTRGPGRGGQEGNSGRNADDVVVNPQGKAAKITSKDHWQTFIDHASEAPLPGLCCRYHLNGRYKRGCHYAETHTALTAGREKAAIPGWIAKCRARMPTPGKVDADSNSSNKKPKLGNSDNAYFSTPSPALATAITSPPTPPEPGSLATTPYSPGPHRRSPATGHRAHAAATLLPAASSPPNSPPQGPRPRRALVSPASPPAVARLVSPAPPPAAARHHPNVSLSLFPACSHVTLDSPACRLDAFPPCFGPSFTRRPYTPTPWPFAPSGRTTPPDTTSPFFGPSTSTWRPLSRRSPSPP